MKKIIYISICALLITASSYAQQIKTNIGGGYFGHTLTHPGLVLEVETEKVFSDKVSQPIRLDLGFYSHNRNQNGLFLDINYGLRRYFNSGLFLEESIGFGVLLTSLNSDGTFKVKEDGSISDASDLNPIDFMPSLTLGIGYNLTKNSDVSNLIWLRPKLSWQLPHKTSSQYHVALQIGFTHTINNK